MFKLKVIISNISVYPFHPYGGTEKRVYYLSKRLSELGVDVEVVASLPKTGQRKAKFDGVTYNFISPQDVWVGCSYDPLQCTRLVLFSLNLAKYLRKRRFDILHTYLTVPFFYLHLKRRSPVVFEPFEEIYDYKIDLLQPRGAAWPLWSRLVRFVKRNIDSYCITHAEAVTSEGTFQTEIFRDLFRIDREKIFYFPVMVDTSTIDRILKQNDLSRKDMGLADDSFVLFSVNRFEPNKGISYLIDAFRLVKNHVKNTRLIIIGSGSQERRIKEKILRNNLSEDVIHFKRVSEEDVYKYAHISDIYVSSTVDTGSMQSIIECMACRLPVVGTTEGPGWVKPGVNGYLVPARDPLSMAEAILKIHDSGKRKFGEKSREIAEQFDYRIFAEKIVQKYLELINNRT